MNTKVFITPEPLPVTEEVFRQKLAVCLEEAPEEIHRSEPVSE